MLDHAPLSPSSSSVITMLWKVRGIRGGNQGEQYPSELLFFPFRALCLSPLRNADCWSIQLWIDEQSLFYFFGTCPVSIQSTDFPNSRLIAKSTAAPGSFCPCSSAERWLWATPIRRANSACVMSNPRSSRILRPIPGRSMQALSGDFLLALFISWEIQYLYWEHLSRLGKQDETFSRQCGTSNKVRKVTIWRLAWICHRSAKGTTWTAVFCPERWS